MTNKICIVAGEPISINSEIIARSWKKLNKFNRNNIFVIGCHSLLVSQFRRLKIKVPLNKIESLDTKFSQKKINILNIPLKFKGPFSINKNDSSNYVLKCLDKAHQLSISGKIKGFINCSVDKKNALNQWKMPPRLSPRWHLQISVFVRCLMHSSWLAF